MSFARQIRLAVWLGPAAALAAVVCYLIARNSGYHAGDLDPSHPVTIMFNVSAFLAAFLLPFLGFRRAAHRQIWLEHFKPSPVIGERFFRDAIRSPLSGGLWRRWLHVDRNGEDKDEAR